MREAVGDDPLALEMKVGVPEVVAVIHPARLVTTHGMIVDIAMIVEATQALILVPWNQEHQDH